MKTFYFRSYTAMAIFAFIVTLNVSVKAQPTSPGDIVFTGFQTSGASTATDQFAFLSVVSMPPGTVIKFTDNAWNSVSSTFNTTESNSIYTNTTGLTIPPGREIRIILGTSLARFTNGTSAGTVVVTGPVSMPTSGEQMFAYIGPDLAPTAFLSGIHFNAETGGCGTTTSAVWDPASCVFPTAPSNNTSMKPATLTTGTNALWSGVEHHNGRFTGCGLPLATAAQVRAAVNNPANWFFEDPLGAEASWAPNGPFAYCAFMGLAPLPVTFVNFTGNLNSNKTITLQWKVVDQQDVHEYVLEKSTDGSTYVAITNKSPGNSTTYSHIDAQVVTGKNLYRLKTVELSGKITYSDIVLITLKDGIRITVYPNPVRDKLTILQFGSMQNKSATLSDGRGKIVQQIKLTTLQQAISMEGYTAGLYILKMEDGTVFKIVKQ